ncbi:MAG: hypothetical protein MHPSP_004518, partial [Paramarteilia canceri]
TFDPSKQDLKILKSEALIKKPKSLHVSYIEEKNQLLVVFLNKNCDIALFLYEIDSSLENIQNLRNINIKLNQGKSNKPKSTSVKAIMLKQSELVIAFGDLNDFGADKISFTDIFSCQNNEFIHEISNFGASRITLHQSYEPNLKIPKKKFFDLNLTSVQYLSDLKTNQTDLKIPEFEKILLLNDIVAVNKFFNQKLYGRDSKDLQSVALSLSTNALINLLKYIVNRESELQNG